MYIGADIGSSFVKMAVIDGEEITEIQKMRTPRVDTGNEWEYEYDTESVLCFIQGYIDSMRHTHEIEGILLSTQMHGFLLGKEGEISNYISWQDERSFRKGHDGKSPVERLREIIQPEMIRRGGVNIKSELSLCGVVAFFEQNGEKAQKHEFYTLGSYIIYRLTGNNITHITNAAPTGMYNIYSGCWNKELIRLAGLGEMKLPDVTEDISVCGYYKGLPVFPDVGDHQTTILGSGIEEGVLNINVGTASQMSMICEAEFLNDEERSEIRPFFDGTYIRVISKLPGGRSLQVIVDFFSDVIGSFTETEISNGEIWKKIDNIDATVKTDLEVNLGFFRSLMFGEGKISEITSCNLTASNIIRGAYTDMARSFLMVMPEFGGIPIERVAICGKFAPALVGIMERLDCENKYFSVPETEAVFTGLARLVPEHKTEANTA